MNYREVANFIADRLDFNTDTVVSVGRRACITKRIQNGYYRSGDELLTDCGVVWDSCGSRTAAAHLANFSRKFGISPATCQRTTPFVTTYYAS